MDLCVGTDLVLVAMEHCTKDGTPKLVRQCTLPLTGQGCVSYVVTELGVFRPSSDGFVVEEIAAGHTLEEIQKRQPQICGCPRTQSDKFDSTVFSRRMSSACSSFDRPCAICISCSCTFREPDSNFRSPSGVMRIIR